MNTAGQTSNLQVSLYLCEVFLVICIMTCILFYLTETSALQSSIYWHVSYFSEEVLCRCQQGFDTINRFRSSATCYFSSGCVQV